MSSSRRGAGWGGFGEMGMTPKWVQAFQEEGDENVDCGDGRKTL